LVVLNPTFIIGPTLVTSLRSSLVAIKAIAEGTMPALPRQRFGVADVRDVAAAHLEAAATPDAANKRYLLLADGPTITWLGLAEAIRDHLGAAGANVTLQEAPGEDPTPLTIHNDRAKQELGWRPRPAETTIVETAESLRDLGLLGDNNAEKR
jgi:nucleoside-diphosphate-sugar epimerase